METNAPPDLVKDNVKKRRTKIIVPIQEDGFTTITPPTTVAVARREDDDISSSDDSETDGDFTDSAETLQRKIALGVKVSLLSPFL